MNDNDKEIYTHDKIELRSEKVRQILGEVPNKFILWGVAVTCLIFAILILIVLLTKYPYGDGETIFEHICNEVHRI